MGVSSNIACSLNNQKDVKNIYFLLSIISVLVTALFLLFSCGTGGNDPEGTGEIDFTNHNTNYSILVRNYTGYNLVAFKGDVKAEKLIGGIPAISAGSLHGLPYRSDLFDKTEEFPLILLTEAQYNANKGNLVSQKNIPFTRMFAFYSKNGSNSTVYEIAEKLGGNNSLRIINPSQSLNVEIRLGGVAGQTIGYAPAGIRETTIKMNDGNFSFFPVFKRYNQMMDVIETVYPKREDGEPYRATTSFGISGNGNTVREYTMNLSDLLKNLPMTSGTALVVIDNQTGEGVRFMEGVSPRKTLSGLDHVPSGYSLTWQIDMRVNDYNYVDSIAVSNWKFGPIGDEVPLQISQTDGTLLGTINIEREKMYIISVKGVVGSTTNPLKAWISDTKEINVDDFYIN